jgi:uncharacterized protein YuzE
MTAELQTWDNARVTYDPEARGWYVYLDKDTPRDLFHSEETWGNSIIFDRDCDGRLTGFEILEG